MACLSCTIILPLSDAAKNYALHLYDALIPIALELFTCFVGCWLIFSIFQSLKGKLQWEKMLNAILVFTLIQTVLKNTHFFWEYIYEPLTNFGAGLLSIVIPTVSKKEVKNLEGLLQVVEEGILQVLHLGEQLGNSGGWTNIVPSILGVLLSLPFVILWAVFIVYTIEYLLKLLVVSALAPFLTVAAAFASTRGYAISAFKIVLQGLSTVLISVIAMGVTLLAIKNATQVFNLNQPNSNLINELSTLSMQFGSLMMLGIVSIVFQLKAPQISSQLLGVSDGPGVAGAVAAGTGSLMAWSGHNLRKGSGWLLSQASQIQFKERTSAAYERLKSKLYE